MSLALLLFVAANVSSASYADSIQKLLDESSEEEHSEVLNTVAKSIMTEHPEDAINYANKALELARKYNNPEEEVKSLLYISDGFFYIDNYDEPLQYIDVALQLSKRLSNPGLTAESYYYKAFYFDYLNDFFSAQNNYEPCIRIYDSLEDKEKVAGISYDFAILLDKQGKKMDAVSYYTKSLENYMALSKEEDAADVLNSMGLLYYHWGNYEKAIKNFNQSLEIIQKNDNKSGVAQILNNLGILYHNWKNYDEALLYYEKSLSLEKELGDLSGIATAYNNIGIIYADVHDFDKALSYYEKSMALNDELGDRSGIATVLNNIGDLYSETGEVELAIIMLKRALKIEKEIADQYGIANAYCTLGELYFKSGNLKLSLQYNDSSFVLAEKIIDTETLLSLYDNYSKIAEGNGDFRGALMYYKKHTELSDSLFSEDMHNQLSEIKAKYEDEQKDQKIELLSSKEKVQKIVTALSLGGFTVIFIVMLILFMQIKKKKAAYKVLDEKNREILSSREQLLHAKERAEESDRLKSTFLANMSHELRTPLNGILGFTDVLRLEIPQEEFRQMADIVHNSGNRLLDTLNSIIDLSIIESNKMELESGVIHLEELISERVSLFMVKASAKNIELSFDVKGKYSLIISDRKVLTNLLNNLIDNGIKYTEVGSVKVIVSLFDNDEKTWLKLEVEDTGIGIEESMVKDIFEKFRQGSEGHDRQFEGSGLGLTICEKYVEILGGQIMLESKLNKGSTFTIIIPVEAKMMQSESLPELESPISKTNEQASHNHDVKPNVLIVENDEINIAHMVYILTKRCNIETAMNGVEALEKADQQNFDVILMDINLGAGMNGMDTAKAIKNKKAYKNIPIIAVTANAMKGHREEFLANGCTHYISKPFSATALKQLIAEVFQNNSY